jgi:hypothetical protein
VTTDLQSASGPWTVEGGYGTISVDLSPAGMIWDEDRQRAIPAVVLRMPGFVADGYAEVFKDWSQICKLTVGERTEEDVAEALAQAAEHAVRLTTAGDEDDHR